MKSQMKVEKIICFVALAICVLSFIFALAITTDIYNLMFLKSFGIKGSDLFYDIQPFNKTLVILCLLMIALTLILFITGTHNRRRYYISNYVTIGIIIVFNIAVSIWALINIHEFKYAFVNEVDYEGWKFACTLIDNIKYTESTFWFDISSTTFYLTILSSLLLGFNLIWKIMLMKYEDDILAGKKALEEVKI